MLEHWPLISLAIAAAFSAILLAAAHWFPYIQRLTRIQAYIIGCAGIFVGFALWRSLNGDWQTPAGLLAIISLSGLTVIAAYRIDHWVLRIRQAHRAEETDDEL